MAATGQHQTSGLDVESVARCVDLQHVIFDR